MDKVEYKIRADEIKALIGEGRYAEAVRIADTIDWKKVRSVQMLCTISDLYKINRRFEESRDVLLMAYDKHPTGRAIVYSLCELAIKMGEFVQAVEYYKEFVRIAPRDTGRYILQYKLYEAQEVSLEERIAVLEEFKKHDYRERWAYELAYLYHRVGLTTECIEECDEMFLWFGEGRYVMKALELKALHEPLSPDQQDRYNRYKKKTSGQVDATIVNEREEVGKDEGNTAQIKSPTKEMPPITDEVLKTYNFARNSGVQQSAETTKWQQTSSASQDQYYQQQYAPTSQEQYYQQQEMPTAEGQYYQQQTDPVAEDQYYQQQYVPTSQDQYYQQQEAPTAESQYYQQQTVPAAESQYYQQQTAPAAESQYYQQQTVPTAESQYYQQQTVPVSENQYYQQQTAPAAENQYYQQQTAPAAENQYYQQQTSQAPEEQYYQPQSAASVIEQYYRKGMVPPQEQTADTIVYQPVEQQETSYAGQQIHPQNEYSQPVREDEIRYPHITEIKEPSVDVSDYNTMNLQETLAEGLREIIASEESSSSDADSEYSSLEDTQSQNSDFDEVQQDEEELEEQPSGKTQEVFFDTQTIEIPSAPQMGIDIKYGGNGPILGQAKYEEKPLEEEKPGAVIHPNASYQLPNRFENILAQESDGQISMAVQPEPEVEKQITGQISIAEYMENWEQFKINQKEKQLERVKQRVADETGDMFADYDVNSKAGLQEKIEKAISDAIKKEQYDKAAGKSDWSVNREDVINAAVAEVIDNENFEDTSYEQENEELQLPEEEKETENNSTEVSVQQDILETEEVSEEPPAEENSKASEKDEVESEIEEAIKDEEVAAQKSENEKERKSFKDKKASRKKHNRDHREHNENKEANETDNKPMQSAPVKTSRSQETSDNKKHIGNREIEERVRTMTPEEKELFGPYIHHKKSRRQIINAIDNLSMDAFTGNAIVTGETGAGTVNLAKGLIKSIQVSDSNFSGKVAKITANTLNKKSTSSIFDKLANGALIIQRAADLEAETVNEMLAILQQENKGLILVMEDTKEDMDKFLDKNPALKQSFNVRVDIEALDDDSLVAYAKQYAYEKEYAIDNLGILALHTRISEKQTLDHEVTVAEVKDIVDDAIYYAEKRSIAHFADVILNKRYDENDMVILREKDFMH